MLSVKEIQDMNISMLGLGRPIEKDGEGYNKPDYARMENIGMLSAMVELSFEETYLTLSTLQKYKNTQLKTYKEELEDTFKAYTEEYYKRYPEEQRWRGERALEDAKNGGNHGLNDYKHRELKYLFRRDDCAVMQFREYINNVDLKPFDGRWMKSQSTGQYAMKVPFEELDRFLEYVSTLGRYGYDAPQELKDELVKFNAEKAMLPEKDWSEIIAHLTPLNKQNSYGYNLYELDMNKNAFNQKLWGLQWKGLSYIDAKSSRDKITISTSDRMLPRLLSFMKENSVDVSAVENAPKIDIKAEMNKSGNTLIDVSSLDLPFKPYPFQVEDAQTVVGKKKAMLGHDMGCVSGDSFVDVLIDDIKMSISISKLYDIFQFFDGIKILSFANGKFDYYPIKAVIDKGIRKTVKIHMSPLYESRGLVCTPDHEIFTLNGWIEAGKLKNRDFIVCDSKYKYPYIVSQSDMIDVSTQEWRNKKDAKDGSDKKLIFAKEALVEYVSEGDSVRVYDIAIDDAEIHNFVCDGIVVHNCGKTFISALVGMSIPEKKLVICPETLRLNWKRELEQANKGADIKVVYSKDKDPQFGKDWTIMGYKTAVKFSGLVMDAKFNCMFVDEAHKCKAVDSCGRPSSQQARTVMTLAQNMTYTYLLTGTPMPTRNKDLYNELVMLGEINPKKQYSFHKFGLKYCNAHNNGFGWDYGGSSNTDELHEMLQRYMTRRLKTEVLPDLTKQRIPIVIEAPLSRDYRNIESRLHKMEKGDTYMGLAMKGRRFLSSCKANAAIEFAKNLLEDDESVVLVAEFNETLDKMMEYFGDAACCIRGGMSDTAKQKAIDEFQSGEKKVCCINLIAAGVGITLTKAHNMVICDFDWTPANMTQVEDRICRTGQKEPCNIFYICHEKAILDDIFMEMITDKSANIDKVIDNAENTVDLVSMREGTSVPAEAGDFLARLKARIEADNAGGGESKVTSKGGQDDGNADTDMPDDDTPDTDTPDESEQLAFDIDIA